ncbi:unnamed protein product [Didymodactylos carnosus]|uniref:Uncharacterized protein n=1 Tax=Didymodactylos carnosus TaxID=1234261 RepID=A0A8S2PUW2_9BILA|nr:unnamed protein product [Didymodactylos carnosus]CAF4072044.1 unnamed protein product [Didymodactylos carnosus]
MTRPSTVRNRRSTNKSSSTTKVSNDRSNTEPGQLSQESSLFSSYVQSPLFYILFVLILAVLIGYIHFQYVYILFENDKHFSHLSTLERELSFRTEMGLYYSYFKQLIESKTFLNGFQSIVHDNRTEAPSIINVLERFNLYPEVILSLIYRYLDSRGSLHQTCYRTERGQTMPPVLSCEGHKEPTYFYVTCVFILNGLLLSTLFVFATYLSQSIYGGLLTTAAYFYNHGEATRVMWTPPLRESFSFPFHVIQLFALTYVLQKPLTFRQLKVESSNNNLKNDASILSQQKIEKIQLILLLSITSILYLLPWQLDIIEILQLGEDASDQKTNYFLA